MIAGPPKGTYWRINNEKFHALDADNRIWWGKDGDNMPRLKRFLSEVKAGKTPQTIWPWKEVGHTQDAKKELLKQIEFEHTENVLNSVKPPKLIRRMLELVCPPNEPSIVVDFFSGSAPTAQAVMQYNADDGGIRQFICVQITEPLPKPEKDFNSIFGMGRKRMINAAKSIRAELEAQLEGELPETDKHQEITAKLANLDTGFRVLKVDSSNMADVYYRPDEVTQDGLALQVENIKPDRSPEDLLFQVLLDWGVDLALPIEQETIAGKAVFFVDGNALAACFDIGLDEDFVKELAKRQPLRAVFRDASFATDATKINIEQIFKALSPRTDLKAI